MIFYKENKLESGQVEVFPIKNYKKGKLIGEGSFGKVYEAFDETKGQLVAFKEFDLNKFNSTVLSSKLDSFKVESELLAKLNHPNIVKFYGVSKNESTISIILEYVIGGSIANIIKQYSKLPEKIVKRYTIQILRGLEYLHVHNCVHRDIKGANILVDRDGKCKLSDFGGAKVILDELEFRQENSLKGTPHWMAPETIKSMEYSRFSDIWSLGCTIIEMITGDPPFSQFKNPMSVLYNIMNAKEPPEISDEYKISEDCRDFIRSCMRIDPKERLNVRKLLAHKFLSSSKKK